MLIISADEEAFLDGRGPDFSCILRVRGADERFSSVQLGWRIPNIQDPHVADDRLHRVLFLLEVSFIFLFYCVTGLDGWRAIAG